MPIDNLTQHSLFSTVALHVTKIHATLPPPQKTILMGLYQQTDKQWQGIVKNCTSEYLLKKGTPFNKLQTYICDCTKLYLQPVKKK